MALNIKDRKTERLASALAKRGESLMLATRRALEERLRRIGGARRGALPENLAEIRRRLSALPVVDPRSADEIIGYDRNGLPG